LEGVAGMVAFGEALRCDEMPLEGGEALLRDALGGRRVVQAFVGTIGRETVVT